MAAEKTTESQPWHAAYPSPKSTPSSISKQELLQLMRERARPGRDFLLVDLRRNDHEGGTIAGSINLPAQSLYPSLPTVYNLVKAAGIPRVIWYCGSSRGRGTRAAAWFADILAAEEDCNVESLILTDGVAGWASAGEEFAVHMHEYDASKWISRTLTSSRSKTDTTNVERRVVRTEPAAAKGTSAP